ncbi:MAG: GTP 3',8-cyclase MoaA [Planctomycetota bacterium]
MRTSFARYIRVSVTDRCNFRCDYCTPSGVFEHLPHEEILSYEEILRILRVASAAGVNKVRITGGEPLVRKNLHTLVESVAAIEAVTEVCLTTNGSLLSRHAGPLKRAGLDRVTVSLDSLRPERFARITGQDTLPEVMAGIDKALEAGLTPLKINAVLLKDFNHDELGDFVDLARRLDIEVRFIEYMPLGSGEFESLFLPGAAVEKRLAELLGSPLQTAEGKGTAKRRFLLPGGGTIGLITPITDSFCSLCDRLRLTSGGLVRACLIKGGEVDVKRALRSGATDDKILTLLNEAWALKPADHGLEPGNCRPHPLECGGMLGIGG